MVISTRIYVILKINKRQNRNTSVLKMLLYQSIINKRGEMVLLPSIPDPTFEAWIALFDGEAPCGQDVTFSDEFESLKEQVDRGTSVHDGPETDWNLVLRLATGILSSQGKDLWVLCYGIIAAYEVQGLNSCAASISALNALLHSSWDQLHPSTVRLQRRLAPLKWLSLRLEANVSKSGALKDRGGADALKSVLKQLQAVLDLAVGDQAPSFAHVLNLLRTEGMEADGQKAALELHSGKLRAGTPPREHPADGGDVLDALDGNGMVPAAVLPRLLRATQDQCRQLATHFASHDPIDWRVFLLHRAALWCTVNQLPAADPLGRTQLKPVPLDKVRSYTAAVENGRYKEVLPLLEASAAKAPFWFDGQFLISRCLERLEFTDSLLLLRIVLFKFLNRFPELVEYKYHDGTPFASPRTREWLTSLQEDLCSGLIQNRTSKEINEASREQNVLEEGIAIGLEHGFHAGLIHIGTVPAGRNRVFTKQCLLQAKYCIALGNKKSAIRLLQSLYMQMEKWEMLDWEPEIGASIISLLLSMQPKERGSGAEIMLNKLHWLHLGMAVGIGKEPKG
jgi:type VI secretion system protein VasJ